MLGVDDSLSNLTSCAISNEASMTSSTNITDQMGTNLQYNHPTQPPSKKRRNLPGNPDPESEVVALSPRALMATNRFVCEVCNKGFQRDQNLQLHRRGHNLPWKLKQRSKLEIIKKKVYVCPEPSCVHHDPSRALGDLTGIKKHFSRKHGEKKWKCEKCSKRYAVQSDWKAHSKICGTREYRCDCGTLFSRRDSFITHRAFCDALAEESSQNRLLSTQTAPNEHPFHHLPLKQETHHFNLPPWLLSSEPGAGAPLYTSSQNPNPNFLPSSTSFMSATALLQKAAQMGVTMSTKTAYQSSTSQDESNFMDRPHHHVGAPGFCAPSSTSTTTTTTAGMPLPSRDDMGTAFLHGLASYGNNKLANLTPGCMQLHHEDHINMVGGPSSTRFDASLEFDQDSFNGILNPKRNNIPSFQDMMRKECGGSGGGGRGGDGMTRDFLGLRAFPHRDFSNMAGFEQMGSSSYDHQNQAPWES
ncbi:hypothetical protein ACS0TY_012391 [Phlomoides rotata]